MLSLTHAFTQFSSIIVGLLGISFIVVFHEFGHFIFCKFFKVHTPTFSIGIGKILVSKKIGDTLFCISAGPIGGYVEVASEDSPTGEKGFNSIPYYQKVLIMLGGIGFNFLLTYILFVGLFWTGMPDTASGPYEPATTYIAKVEPTSINASSLQNSDHLISLNNQILNDDITIARSVITQATQANLQTIPALIMRNGQSLEVLLQLKGNKVPPVLQKQLEINMVPKPPLQFFQSLRMAGITLNFYLHAIITGLKDMISTKNTKGFVGPIMAIAASSKSVQKGCAALFFLLAIISLNLGFMNLLPLPIFDGGQFVIFTTEAIIGHQLSERVRHWIAVSSWVLALGLLIIFTIRDIHTLFFHQ